MTRELKFRAWKDEEKLEPVLPGPGDRVEILDLDEYDHCWVSVDCIEQFTGMKDKNGRDIYEGDIVRVVNRDSDLGIIDDYVGTVIFKDGAFGVRRESQPEDEVEYEDTLSYFSYYEYEIEVQRA